MQPLTWTTRQILEQALPGSIIVLHDGHGHGTKVAQVIEAVVPTLKAQGYEFVTVAELSKK
jgi:peptidoglycan/xylan/chitin deacetylase (PgdA/CDA1 family)